MKKSEKGFDSKLRKLTFIEVTANLQTEPTMTAKLETLLAFIRSHDGIANVRMQPDGQIRLAGDAVQYLPDGTSVPFTALVIIPATVQAAREWLGY